MRRRYRGRYTRYHQRHFWTKTSRADLATKRGFSRFGTAWNDKALAPNTDVFRPNRQTRYGGTGVSWRSVAQSEMSHSAQFVY